MYRWSPMTNQSAAQASAAPSTTASFSTTPASRAASMGAVPGSGILSTSTEISSRRASACGALPDRLRRAPANACSLQMHCALALAAATSRACAVPAALSDALNSALASRKTFNA